MKKKIIIILVLLLIIGLVVFSIYSYKNSKDNEEIFEFDAQIGDIYSDNNVTMEPVQIGDLKFTIPSLKIEDSKLALTLRFDYTDINSLNFYYFLYNTKNTDDVLLIASQLYDDRFKVLDKFAKDNNLPKKNKNSYFSTDKIHNFTNPTLNLYTNNEYELIVYSENTSGAEYDANLLKDGLTFKLFNINYQPVGKDVVNLDNQSFRIKFKY